VDNSKYRKVFFCRPSLSDWLEFRTISSRIEVRPLASAHFERAHHPLVHIDEAERVRLQGGSRDLPGTDFQKLKTATNRSHSICAFLPRQTGGQEAL
jgi:hypothetical protein